MLAELSEKELADLLQRTEQAHKTFESKKGQTDPDWSAWYAHYMLQSLQER